MGFLKGLAYFFGASFSIFALIVLIIIVVAVSLGIKYALEKNTSLNKESITAITVICGILAFFVLAGPVFFGTGFGLVSGFVNALVPDF